VIDSKCPSISNTVVQAILLSRALGAHFSNENAFCRGLAGVPYYSRYCSLHIRRILKKIYREMGAGRVLTLGQRY